MKADKFNKLPKWAREEVVKIEERSALRWPTETRPTPIDLQSEGANTGKLVVGWFANGRGSSIGRSHEVSKGCSSGTFHSRSNPHKTDSQGGGKMYHTKREALIEARWQMCERYAQALAIVDADIENETE